MSLRDPLAAMQTPKVANTSGSSSSSASRLDAIQTPDADEAAEALRAIAASVLPEEEVDRAVRRYLLQVHERHVSGDQHPDEITDDEAHSWFRGYGEALGGGSSSSPSASSSSSESSSSSASSDQALREHEARQKSPARDALREMARAISNGGGPTHD